MFESKKHTSRRWRLLLSVFDQSKYFLHVREGGGKVRATLQPRLNAFNLDIRYDSPGMDRATFKVKPPPKQMLSFPLI